MWGKNLRLLHDFGNGHELFDAQRPVLRRLMTAVVFLDSALSQDLARVLIYTRAARGGQRPGILAAWWLLVKSGFSGMLTPTTPK